MNGAKICIFKKANHVGLSRLLERKYCLGLEAEIRFEFLGDFSDESLERQFADEELSRFLETADLAESNSAGLEAVGLLDAPSRHGGCLTGCFISELLAGGFRTRVLASSLFGAGHLNYLDCFARALF